MVISFLDEKSLCRLRYDPHFPVSFLNLLNEKEWIDMLNYIKYDFGYATWGVKSRAAWGIQVMALLTFFSKKYLVFNTYKILFPSTKDVNSALDFIENFNESRSSSEETSYSEISLYWSNSELLKRNLRISEEILSLIFSFLKEYLKGVDTEDYSLLSDVWWEYDSWADFYNEYYKEFAKDLRVLIRKFMPDSDIECICIKNSLNEFIKILMLFSYIMNECFTSSEKPTVITRGIADYFYAIRGSAFRMYYNIRQRKIQETKKCKNSVATEDSTDLEDIVVEPPVQVLPVEKSIFKFSLFGYKFSFTAKKEKPPKPVNIADEFPDEIEY